MGEADSSQQAGAPLEVTIVYAVARRAHWYRAQLRAGATVWQAIEACGILADFPELSGCTLDVGIFGQCCPLDRTVRDGDRIEIYRPLAMDPKEARRQRAALKQD